MKTLQSWLVIVLILFLICSRSVAEEQSSYQLGPGDTIRIQVFGEQDMSLDAKLSDAGTVIYPFMGEIKVSGLTISQVAKLITDGLNDRYLVDPKVSVGVLEYRPFFINGEVGKPGAYPYQPGLIVQKAVTIAGGFSERASRSSVTLIRDSDPTHASADVDLDTAVMPGDVITVEESFF
ncbi:polysaccharide biosynthesis/export family protein [Methylocaldum sp.]|uniref:polysaccharide biosynthesis/export family protein n=1 Tax=Methylocaldum sp. TaxID=1969727 RepID=UPI002D4EAFC1|nr:polysaccharide biosynthesis/export family protein [Methylocaldum sp.]HYE35695.1 polysaccharide biosynthesis/export family protein [Methylocaldum sp.]